MDWMLMGDGRWIHRRDYSIAMAVGQDAANRQMERFGRKAWNEDDADLAAEKANNFMRACAIECVP